MIGSRVITHVFLLLAAMTVTDTPASFRGLWLPNMHQTMAGQQPDTRPEPELRQELWDIFATAEQRQITDVFVQVNMHDVTAVGSTRFDDVISDGLSRNIKIHLWLNLFRLGERRINVRLPVDDVCRLLGDHCYRNEQYTWMVPTAPAVQEHVTKTVLGLINR